MKLFPFRLYFLNTKVKLFNKHICFGVITPMGKFGTPKYTFNNCFHMYNSSFNLKTIF